MKTSYKGYFEALRGNADEGYDFDAFFELNYQTFRFNKAENIKTEGYDLPEAARQFISPPAKPVEDYAEISGETPTKEQFIESELKKFKEWPSPDPDGSTFIYNVVQKYKMFLEEKLSETQPKKSIQEPRRRIAAFYIIEEHNKEIINLGTLQKTELIEYIYNHSLLQKQFPGLSGQTVTDTIKYGHKQEVAFYLNYEKAKTAYSEDYNKALELFKEDNGN